MLDTIEVVLRPLPQSLVPGITVLVEDVSAFGVYPERASVLGTANPWRIDGFIGLGFELNATSMATVVVMFRGRILCGSGCFGRTSAPCRQIEERVRQGQVPLHHLNLW